jgi:predicted DNA-binding protein
MKQKKGKARAMKSEGNTASVRATIMFPSEVYESLEGIAKQKKVSLAWVVREAAEQYLADKWPLFAKGEAESRK